MAWSVPPLPNRGHQSVINYWLAVLELPDDDPAAPALHAMAMQRLSELGALPESEPAPTAGTSAH